MNYNLYINIQSSFNPEISQDEKFDILYAVLKEFSERLLSSSLCLSVNIKESNYMLEGSQKITLQIKAKFVPDSNKDKIKALLKSIAPKKVGIIIFNDLESGVFGASLDTKSNFIESDNVALVKNLSDFPSDLHSIDFTGIYARTSSDKPQLIIKCFNNKKEPLEINDSWVNDLKSAYSKTFSASDIDSLPLSYLIRLMIGNNPSVELSNALNNTLMITTEYMKETMRFDEYKNLEDCPMYLDFD
jgi:hypothetical protein